VKAPDPLSPIHTGKVRETYAIGGTHLLVVASDRISVFDVVLDQPVPDKGKVLTALTEFWLTELLKDIPNHYVAPARADTIPTPMLAIPDLEGRGMVVRRAEMLKVECIVRGYLEGSGLKDYQKTGAVCGIPLPDGLVRGSRLPEPIFTPSTKADVGHDENIDFESACYVVNNQFPGRGRELMELAREFTLDTFDRVGSYALERGVIVADTKLEFGIADGELILCDEVYTPDSSRFWPLETWEPGTAPQSLDKQFVRDYYESLGWDKTPPAPPLPDAIVEGTRLRYFEVYQKLTGRPFAGASGMFPS
jgi:phosphoribosylaminoimidazole-succinocarboxamide synthase